VKHVWSHCFLEERTSGKEMQPVDQVGMFSKITYLMYLRFIGDLANWIRVIPWFDLHYFDEKVHIFNKLNIAWTFIAAIKVLEIENICFPGITHTYEHEQTVTRCKLNILQCWKSNVVNFRGTLVVSSCINHCQSLV
jgi:hypothetical protein